MRDHILTVAEKLFYEEGTRTVGVDRIIAEANVAKATLYRHFPAKEDLVESYLQARHDRIIATLTHELAAATGSPKDRLLKIFELLEAKADLPLFRGCAFLIAVAENESSASILHIAREHKAAITALLLDIAQTLPVDPAPLVQQIALCYEGALAIIAVHRTAHAARTGRDCAALLIETRRLPPDTPDDRRAQNASGAVDSGGRLSFRRMAAAHGACKSRHRYRPLYSPGENRGAREVRHDLLR